MAVDAILPPPLFLQVFLAPFDRVALANKPMALRNVFEVFN